MNLQEALRSKGFKQSDEGIKIPQAGTASQSLEKEDSVTTESKKEWK